MINKVLLKNILTPYLMILLFSALLSACGGTGGSSPVTPTGNVLGVLPTGSTVSITESQINIINLIANSATLRVTGGTPGITYEFSFNVAPNIPTINPSTCVITTGRSQDSCTITFNPNFASNGVYTVSVLYNMLNSNHAATNLVVESANNSLANPIQLILSGSTQVKLISPTTTSSVGVGTPISVQFNNPIESTTVNANTFLLTDHLGNLVTAQGIVVGANSESATFIVTSRFQNTLLLDSAYSVKLTNGIIDQNNQPINESTFTFETQKNAYHVFLTKSAFNGDLVSAANALQNQMVYTDGIAAADYLCQRDILRPNDANYKALIVDGKGIYRSAAPTPLNWVMQPFAQYNNPTESKLFITGINPSSASPIYLAVSSVTFNSTWLNGFASLPQLNFYDGLIQNWTNSQNTCNSWTNSGANVIQYSGTYFSSTPLPTTLQISSSYGTCNGASNLLCVEQPQ